MLSLKHQPQSSGILAERLDRLNSAFSLATCQGGYALCQMDARSEESREKFGFLGPKSEYFGSFIMPSLIVLPWSRVCLTKYVSLAPETSVVLFPTMALAICEGRLLTFH